MKVLVSEAHIHRNIKKIKIQGAVSKVYRKKRSIEGAFD